MRKKRPLSVTLLSVGVLSIAVTSLVRFTAALQEWTFLSSLPGVNPLYLAITGLVWAAVWMPVGLALWLGKAWGPAATLAAAAVYTLYWWADRLFVANVSLDFYSGSAWHFRAAATLVLLALVLWILSRPKARAFFRSDV